ncbi:uncharacterized protein CDAR_23451 [Caerostris darwini]|uniref:Peptidase M10 metallopeptidase domain-containing protein n=1 Tax=Caerostris darwini TaxID=1538125 RepID=A0AAV4T481_9ARAC|nr:uncharacterized protein CDAR_23451 [Caerostris darwini]
MVMTSLEVYGPYEIKASPLYRCHMQSIISKEMVFIGCVLYNLLPCEPHVTEEIHKKIAQWESKHRLKDQFMYEMFVLQPHSAYCVPSGTRYLTMTCQKTLFSLHVVAADAALPPELNLLSPTSTRKLNAGLMSINIYRDPEKSKFKRIKSEAQQQQHVSTDPQQHVSTDPQQHVSTDPQQHVSTDPQQHVSTDPQQHVSTDPQQQRQPLSYLVSNETNQFLQVSGEMIGNISRPKIIYLQIPDMEVYRNIMQPNALEYFRDKFNKINQEYHLAMNELLFAQCDLLKNMLVNSNPTLNKNCLAWSLVNGTNYSFLHDVLEMWNIEPLEFVRVDPGKGDTNIYFKIMTNEHVMGYAHYPEEGKVFINDKLKPNQIFSVLQHELGHPLGLTHDVNQNSTMFPYFLEGMIVEKYHRTLAFRQRSWLAEYIHFNNEKQKEAKEDFTCPFCKKINNSFFGSSDY